MNIDTSPEGIWKIFLNWVKSNKYFIIITIIILGGILIYIILKQLGVLNGETTGV